LIATKCMEYLFTNEEMVNGTFDPESEEYELLDPKKINIIKGKLHYKIIDFFNISLIF
jgi:hypothetical protein